MDGDYYLNNNDKDLAKNIKNFNKNSHLEIFDGKGQYDTTTNDHYKYNFDDAKNAYNPLNPQSRINLRSTHYQLGEGGEFEKDTTNRRDYIAYPSMKLERVPSGKRNFDNVGVAQGIFEGNTIYQTDFTKKPLPVRDDEELEKYLLNKYYKENNAQ